MSFISLILSSLIILGGGLFIADWFQARKKLNNLKESKVFNEIEYMPLENKNNINLVIGLFALVIGFLISF